MFKKCVLLVASVSLIFPLAAFSPVASQESSQTLVPSAETSEDSITEVNNAGNNSTDAPAEPESVPAGQDDSAVSTTPDPQPTVQQFLAPSSGFVYDKTLKQGMAGEAVEKLKEGLKKYFPKEAADVTVNTIFDSATTKALKKIQKANKVYPDGQFGIKTANIVQRKGMNMWILPPLKSKTALSVGQHGYSITLLQAWLKHHYQNSMKACNFWNIDGIFGSGTRSCVSQVQKSLKIRAHGAVDGTTADKMKSVGINITVPPVPAFGSMVASRTLWSGYWGNPVRNIQSFFAYYFPQYTPYKPDGGFGRLTKKSIQSFQKQHGIGADGGYGKLTAAAMRQYGADAWILTPVYTSWNLVEGSGKNTYVENAQSWLQRGFPLYCTMPVNGVFQKTTTNCVNKVRAHYGLTQNGVIDPALSMKLVKDGHKIHVKNAPTPSKAWTSSNLTVGSKNSAVQALQMGLNKYYPQYAGFYPDGTYGAKTKAAVQKFQRAHGIGPDGAVGMWTASVLRQKNIPVWVIPSTTLTSTLKKGSYGHDVRVIQLALSYLYPQYCDFIADGGYGAMTSECVKKVQKANGVYSDGMVGKQTAKILRSKGFSINYVGYRTPGGYLQPTSKITPLSSGYTNTLTYGMNGVKVRIAQKRLGIWGTMTLASVDSRMQNAVRNFQRRAGIGADGVVGQRTWNAMRTGYSWTVDQYQAKPISLEATRSERINAMINYAMAQRGSSYTWGGAGTYHLGYDCSGLALQSLYAAGLDPQPINVVKHAWPKYRTSQELYKHPKLKHVPLSQRQRGDLIFYQKGGTVFHVAIYLGGNQVVHTDWMGRPARVQNIALGYGWGAITSTVVRPFP
ncbi:MAG: peptidoglycan-binding protein [Actinomycetaceae bacterium]|nr:peptidoglycan-binding protein [Actinomycetaceae bacterium]MDO5747037.1 peptidoglycan-binding protein [Actinomycetaceae bacterium]